jgi:hypothetical protein
MSDSISDKDLALAFLKLINEESGLWECVCKAEQRQKKAAGYANLAKHKTSKKSYKLARGL